jgi:hypothetical protein
VFCYGKAKVSFLLLIMGLLLGTTGMARAGYQPTSTDPPDWYTQASDDGLSINGVGSDTVTAFVNAVGALARQMDPNVNRMSEGYGEKSQEKLVRVLAEATFDSVAVHSMSQHYQYRSRGAFSGESDLRRMVRIVLPSDGDTICEYKSYLEEIQSDISTTYIAKPDPEYCTPQKLEKALARRGIRLVRSEPRLVRHYVQIRYQKDPVRDFGKETRSDSSPGLRLEERSLKKNKKAMEKDMEENLEDVRRDRESSDTESRSNQSGNDE